VRTIGRAPSSTFSVFRINQRKTTYSSKNQVRAAIDTNILVYAEGVGDAKRCKLATDWVAKLDVTMVVIPAQVLGELYNVLTRKAGRGAAVARDSVLGWSDAFQVADSTEEAVTAACDLAAAHQLQFWDALIVSVAVRQHCRLLLTEELGDGFVWQGLTVVNPFSATPNPLLARALDLK
jgi:predicted nucleic acid-binding protein